MPDIDKHWINSDYYHYYCMNSSTQEQNKIKHRDIQFQDDNRKLYSYSFISNRSQFKKVVCFQFGAIMNVVQLIMLSTPKIYNS